MTATGPGVNVNPPERASLAGEGAMRARFEPCAPMTPQRPAPNGTRHG